MSSLNNPRRKFAMAKCGNNIFVFGGIKNLEISYNLKRWNAITLKTAEKFKFRSNTW